MPKLIDAEAAKAAIEGLIKQCDMRYESTSSHPERLIINDKRYGMKITLAALDALPDASEKAIHTERISVPPHLAEAQRVVIWKALAAQPQEGE